MLIDELLKLLKNDKTIYWKKGFLTRNIRGLLPDNREVCPITAACFLMTGDYHSPVNDYRAAAKKLNIDQVTMNHLVTCADNEDTWTILRGKSLRGMLVDHTVWNDKEPKGNGVPS